MKYACYLRMRDDAVHLENLLIRVSLSDVKLPHYSRPIALTTAAAEVITITEMQSHRGEKSTII